MLDARIALRLGDLDLDAHVAVGDREVVALLGPNGAGKTTIVRAVAGLCPIDEGAIRLDGDTLDDPAADVFVPPERRPIGVVFQDYLLFPRMDVLDNVAFGLRARGADRRGAAAGAMTWLERLGIDALAHRRPAELSGGQAQRVALARAVASEPRLLLLDEPLAALDATTRAHVRAELRRHLATFAGGRLLVTHDPVDALVLADRLVILEQGRVTQAGTPAEVAARPATPYVADLVGINLLHAVADGSASVALDSGAQLTVGEPVAPGISSVAVAVRPQAVALYRQRPDGSPRNTWRATVADLEADRDRVRVLLAGPVPLTAEITASAAEGLGLRAGDQVWAAVKATEIDVYER